MIDEGYYWAKPVGGKLTTSGKNTPTFAVEIVLEGTDDKRTLFLHCSDAAWPYTESKLQRMGWDGNADEMGFSAERIECQCTHEVYNNKPREKWDIAKEQSEFEPAADDVKRQILARWKGGAAKTKSKPDAAPARASTAPASAPPRSAPARATPKPRDLEPAKSETEAWEVFYRQCTEINPKREQKSVEEEFDRAIESVAKGRDKKALTEKDWTEIANSAIPF